MSVRERAGARGWRERQREKQTPHWAGSPMRGSIPGPRDHDLSPRQTLVWLTCCQSSDWATQVPQDFSDFKPLNEYIRILPKQMYLYFSHSMTLPSQLLAVGTLPKLLSKKCLLTCHHTTLRKAIILGFTEIEAWTTDILKRMHKGGHVGMDRDVILHVL